MACFSRRTPEFIKKVNGLLAAGSNGIGEIVPPTVIPAD